MVLKVIVGLSGGVDSSVAALLLKEQGYEVEGLFMKNWEEDDSPGYCAAAKDLADAQAVAKALDIVLHSVNFSKTYWDSVFAHFLHEYASGRTPNPDVLCNKEIKFKAFLAHAQDLGADLIATGHYARVDKGALYKAKDKDKDQSYFLHAVSPKALEKTLFPLGNYLKTEVRALAKAKGLITHDKKDSTGICFIGERRFKAFLKEFMLAKPGEIRSTEGVRLGSHDGLMFYTLGQRQGLGVGGSSQSNGQPWYVVDKELASNTLIVAQGRGHPSLYSQGLIAGPIHFLKPLSFPLSCYAKVRYRQMEFPCMVSAEDEGKHHVMFAAKQAAVTPGQYVVLYDKNQCLGGAVIEALIQ